MYVRLQHECACACFHPHHQRIVEGWPQGCVPWWVLLLAEHTQVILIVAIGLARGRNGWNIWLVNQPETFSLEPLRRIKTRGETERGREKSALWWKGCPGSQTSRAMPGAKTVWGGGRDRSGEEKKKREGARGWRLRSKGSKEVREEEQKREQ